MSSTLVVIKEVGGGTKHEFVFSESESKNALVRDLKVKLLVQKGGDAPLGTSSVKIIYAGNLLDDSWPLSSALAHIKSGPLTLHAVFSSTGSPVASPRWSLSSAMSSSSASSMSPPVKFLPRGVAVSSSLFTTPPASSSSSSSYSSSSSAPAPSSSSSSPVAAIVPVLDPQSEQAALAFMLLGEGMGELTPQRHADLVTSLAALTAGRGPSAPAAAAAALNPAQQPRPNGPPDPPLRLVDLGLAARLAMAFFFLTSGASFSRLILFSVACFAYYLWEVGLLAAMVKMFVAQPADHQAGLAPEGVGVVGAGAGAARDLRPRHFVFLQQTLVSILTTGLYIPRAQGFLMDAWTVGLSLVCSLFPRWTPTAAPLPAPAPAPAPPALAAAAPAPAPVVAPVPVVVAPAAPAASTPAAAFAVVEPEAEPELVAAQRDQAQDLNQEPVAVIG